MMMIWKICSSYIPQVISGNLRKYNVTCEKRLNFDDWICRFVDLNLSVLSENFD